MSTGYTQIIEDKADVTFREFALRCARAFGACVMQRDECSDAPPRHREVDAFYRESVAKRQARCLELEGMSVEQANVIAAAEYASALKSHEASKAVVIETHRRYSLMRAKVSAWTPPTPDHARLREFMLEQIDLCYEPDIDFDRWAPAQLSGEAWLSDRYRRERNYLSYAEDSLRKEESAVASANKWIDALLAALPEGP